MSDNLEYYFINFIYSFIDNKNLINYRLINKTIYNGITDSEVQRKDNNYDFDLVEYMKDKTIFTIKFVDDIYSS